MTKFISLKKYGYSIQHYVKNNNDIVYYICYPDHSDLTTSSQPKMKRIKIGSHSEGIRESYAKKIRDEVIVNLRLGNTFIINKK